MHVKVWDIELKHWLDYDNISHIVNITESDEFKLDGQIFLKKEYELEFIDA